MGEGEEQLCRWFPARGEADGCGQGAGSGAQRVSRSQGQRRWRKKERGHGALTGGSHRSVRERGGGNGSEADGPLMGQFWPARVRIRFSFFPFSFIFFST